MSEQQKPVQKEGLSPRTVKVIEITGFLASIATIIGLVISLININQSRSDTTNFLYFLATSQASNDSDEISLNETKIAFNETLASGDSGFATLPVTTRTPTLTIEPSFTPSIIPSATLPPLPTSTPTDFMTPTPATVVPINQSQYSIYKEIELIVDSVELLPDGSMRWNLSFWNRGTGNVTIGIENTKTYLADESGNRYSVINDDANNGSLGHSVYTVQPGERQRHWLTFPARIDNAQTFTVGLVSFGCCSANWVPFLITVNFP